MRDLHLTRREAGLPDPSTIKGAHFVEATSAVLVEVEEKRTWSPAPRQWLFARRASESRYVKLFGPDDRTDAASFAIAQHTGDVFVLVRRLREDGLAADLPEVVRIATPHGEPRTAITESALKDRWISQLLHASEDGATLTVVVGRRHDVNDVERDIAYVAKYSIARVRLSDLSITELAALPGIFF